MARKSLQSKLIEHHVDNPSRPREVDFEGLAALLCGGPLGPTQRRFIFDPDPRKWFVGPVGSGKTTSLVAAILLPALIYPESRWMISRWTYSALEETTMEAVDECLSRLGRDAILHEVKSPYRKIWIKTGMMDEKGKPRPPSVLIFRSLDEMSKFGSFRLNGIGVDESDEITQQMAETLWKRCRYQMPWQKPLQQYGPYFFNMASNAPSRGHWLHKRFCGGPDGDEDADLRPWGTKYNPEPEENIGNLPPGYYNEDEISPEMRIRLLGGKCGPSATGLPVFGQQFNYQMHTASNLRPIVGLPGYRAWDFGRRRPACVWGQMTPEGWINRYYAMLGKEEGLRSFARRVVQITNTRFAQIPSWVEYVDPRGEQKTDASELSSHDILTQEFGMDVRFRYVNVDPRIEEMENGLNTMKNGRPVSMFDRQGCSILIEGYMGGYTYGEARVGGALRNSPKKDGYYEHVMDADGYGMINLTYGPIVKPSTARKSMRRVRNPITGY